MVLGKIEHLMRDIFDNDPILVAFQCKSLGVMLALDEVNLIL